MNSKLKLSLVLFSNTMMMICANDSREENMIVLSFSLFSRVPPNDFFSSRIVRTISTSKTTIPHRSR